VHKVYRKKEWMRAALAGGAFASLRKPTTPEWVDAVAQTPQIDAVILTVIAAVRGKLQGAHDLRIPGTEIEALARWLARWTLDLVGVEIEGEQGEEPCPLVWAELTEAERVAFWEEAGIDDLTQLWACLKIGRRGDDALDAARIMAISSAGLDITPAPAAAPAPEVKKKSRSRKKKNRG
jgi:hypothetical protein